MIFSFAQTPAGTTAEDTTLNYTLAAAESTREESNKSSAPEQTPAADLSNGDAQPEAASSPLPSSAQLSESPSSEFQDASST